MTLVRSLVFAAVCGATLVAASSLQAADGSGLFDFLFRDALKRQGMQPTRPEPERVAPRQSASVSIGQERTYCVRTCDGYYFAIGIARTRAERAEDEAMCSSSCGGGEMRLYSAPLAGDGKDGRTGPAIERAVDSAGALYTTLRTAYAFRNAESAACACKSTANGLPQIPISIDPTLREGDIIVTQDGLKVFRGTPDAPHRDDDFVSVADEKSLPTIVRQQMLSLQTRIAE